MSKNQFSLTRAAFNTGGLATKQILSRLVQVSILTAALLGLPPHALADGPVVSNLRASQRPGTQLVDITYDLADADSATVSISVTVSTNGGTSYDLQATSFTGALGGGVTQGLNKQVTWDAGADWPNNSSATVRFRISADDGGGPSDMVPIPAGSFTMGNCMSLSDGVAKERPLHSVYVSRIYMDKYEVTKKLWDTVKSWATANGYDFDNAGLGKAANHPVQTVNWWDCVKWCNARSEKEGRDPAYYTSASQTTVYRSGQLNLQNTWVKWNGGYRLPTEAEWEKGARGGASGHRFPWSHTDEITHSLANYYSTTNYTYDTSPTRGFHPTFSNGGGPYTSPVGYFAPNGYALYDMAGNVWEWCWDWFGSYSSSAQTDPHGPSTGTYRLMRGNSYKDVAWFCRVALRYNVHTPDFKYDSIGFRTVLASGLPSAQSGIITVDTTTGSLLVIVSPPEAATAGAAWRRVSTPPLSWHNGGETETSIPVGPCTIEFSAASGWLKPANANVVIAGGATNTLVVYYKPLLARSPINLDFGDTQTQLTFDVWNSGGGTLTYELTNMPAWATNVVSALGSSSNALDIHTHTVTIDRSLLALGTNSGNIVIRSAQAGNSPQTVQVQAVCASPPAVGSLQVNINPQGAIEAGAQWRRVGTATWRNSGETESGISVGSYAVEFKDITTWIKPANATVAVLNGQTTQAAGTYEPTISGTISFRDRAGNLLNDQTKIPQSVWITIWGDVPGTNYQWPARQARDLILVLNAGRTASISYSIPSGSLRGDQDYTLEVSVYPGRGDAKRIRFHLPAAKLALGIDVVLTYQNLVSDNLFNRLCRKSGKNITYQFGPWPGPNAEAETNAVKRALKTWERTGIVGFKEIANFDPDIWLAKMELGDGLGNSYPDPVSRKWVVRFDDDPGWVTSTELNWVNIGTVEGAFVGWVANAAPMMECAAVHEIGHVLGLRCSEFPWLSEGPYGDSVRQQWSVMDYLSVREGQIVWLGWSDIESLKSLQSSVAFIATGPADLVITDPHGLVTTITNAGIPGSQYYESDGGGASNHFSAVLIDCVAAGNYDVRVVPHPNADTNAIVSLAVQGEAGETPLTVSLPLTGVPTDGFRVYAEPGQVLYDECAFDEPLSDAQVWVRQGTAMPLGFHVVDCERHAVTEPRDLVMEICGPGVGGQLETNLFSVAKGTLVCDTPMSPPTYMAAFDTRTNGAQAVREYRVVVKQHGAPIGSVILLVSTNQDSRMKMVHCTVESGTRLNLYWKAFTEQVWIESSGDLATWEPFAGPLTANRWSGDLPVGGTRRFFRIRGEVPGQ